MSSTLCKEIKKLINNFLLINKGWDIINELVNNRKQGFIPDFLGFNAGILSFIYN